MKVGVPLQSISDSCRYLTTMEWHKQREDPPELADELDYKCGDAATEKELKGSYFPNKDAAQFLNVLLQPLVVSCAGHLRAPDVSCAAWPVGPQEALMDICQEPKALQPFAGKRAGYFTKAAVPSCVAQG